MTRHHSRPGAGTGSYPAGVVRVLTRNVYVGAQVDGVVFAPSVEVLPERVDATLRALLASQFPERVRPLARDLQSAAADLVALQEVARLTIRRPDAARADAQDYLEILLAELRALGVPHMAVGICQAADVELTGGDGGGVRLTARNVILARDHVEIGTVASDCYATNLHAVVGGAAGRRITLLRGWVSADVMLGTRVLRVINTHFETQAHPDVQRAQCEELLRFVAASPHPCVVVGDLNSDAAGGDTESYRSLVASGLRDAWLEVRRDDGYTCCHDPDLRNPESRLTKRIDHVLVAEGVEVLDADLVGAGVESRTESGLWASDHAGVVATLRLPG